MIQEDKIQIREMILESKKKDVDFVLRQLKLHKQSMRFFFCILTVLALINTLAWCKEEITADINFIQKITYLAMILGMLFLYKDLKTIKESEDRIIIKTKEY